MKTYLLTFIFLNYVMFVVSLDLSYLLFDKDGLESKIDNENVIPEEVETEDPEQSTTQDMYVNVSTSENPSSTEHYIETTAAPNNCPEGQSFYSKQDLVLIINYFAKQHNIDAKITKAYQELAVNISDKLLKKLEDVMDKTRERPQHLNHVLDDIENNRKTNIAVLVKIANASLQQMSVHENIINMLSIKTTTIEKDIEEIKELCRINKCPQQQMRSYKTAIDNNESEKRQGDDSHFCSSATLVKKTVVDRLSEFEGDAITIYKQEVLNKQNVLENAISLFKKELNKEAVSSFGVAMYDILSIMDDQFHIEESLKKFNEDMTIDLIKQKYTKIEYVFAFLDTEIQRKRQICRTCPQVQRSGYIILADDDLNEKNIETTTENKPTLLDQLIDVKINEINKTAESNVNKIFKNLTLTVTNESDVREIIKDIVYSTKPIQEEVIKRTDQAKKALEALMESASEKSREHAREVLDQVTKLKKYVEKMYETLSGKK